MNTRLRILASPEAPKLPTIDIYERKEAKKGFMGKETTPALIIVPTDQFDRFVNSAISLRRYSEDACYIMKVAKAANYQVTQESMYQAQEQVINDLKEENAELTQWKYHTIDYDELEERVSVLEKTVATLKKVAVKLFRFVKNLVFDRGGEEMEGLEAFKQKTDIEDDPEEKEMLEEIERESRGGREFWF